MRSQKLKFAAVIAGFALLWLCVRFPYEARTALGRLLIGSDQIDPLTLHLQGEFVESNLGTAMEPDGSVTVRLIAQQFNFVPSCTLVPTGVPVHFRIASADVVHRFTISGTDHALEIVPGRVTESEVSFDSPGEHKTPCHEFCGAGHYNMLSRIVVVAGNRFPRLKSQERLTCATP